MFNETNLTNETIQIILNSRSEQEKYHSIVSSLKPQLENIEDKLLYMQSKIQESLILIKKTQRQMKSKNRIKTLNNDILSDLEFIGVEIQELESDITSLNYNTESISDIVGEYHDLIEEVYNE